MTTQNEKPEMTVATAVLPSGQKVTFWRGQGRQESVTTRVALLRNNAESVTRVTLLRNNAKTAEPDGEATE